MSLALPTTASRAGVANCLCPPGTAGDPLAASAPFRTLALLSAGAAASVLSQALMFSLLPLAGQMLAPLPSLSAIPFIALFVGAVAATFPASILTDAFGRRAAFALGASLGVAGGLVVAWGLVFAAFWPLAVGAFWIGVANGFALQYRHAAAGGATSEARRAVAIVVGSGAIIGFIAPTLAGFAELKLTPFVGAGTALLAAAAHVFALGAAMALPVTPSEAVARPRVRSGGYTWLVPTLIAAAAWFGMMAIMAFAPLGLALCGVGFSVTVGVIAWHLVAMYAPALALGVSVDKLGAGPIALGGLGLIGLSALGLAAGPSESAIVIALIAAGAGWSLATSAAVIVLHQKAPSRLAIAAHDACIMLAGVGGAILSGPLFR
jgi:hypothetical protein